MNQFYRREPQTKIWPDFGSWFATVKLVHRSEIYFQKAPDMLTRLLWTQDTCNPMPFFESSWNPIGTYIKYDPMVPDAPISRRRIGRHRRRCSRPTRGGDSIYVKSLTGELVTCDL